MPPTSLGVKARAVTIVHVLAKLVLSKKISSMRDFEDTMSVPMSERIEDSCRKNVDSTSLHFFEFKPDYKFVILES